MAAWPQLGQCRLFSGAREARSGWSSFKDKSPWGVRSREWPQDPSQIGTAVWGFWGLLVTQHSLSPGHALSTPGGGHPRDRHLTTV